MLAKDQITSPEIPALSVRDVSVSYGNNRVLQNFSLDIMHGETFGLIGLNGVGKTTLIKAVLGLRDTDAGAISVDGRARLDRESKKKIAFLPERFDPPWFLSGLEFINFSARLYGAVLNRQDIVAMAERLALNPSVLGKRVQSYSKGMRQKLGILATLMTGCPLLILDEPMSGLDPLARARVKDLLRETRKEGRTVFFSSHILSDMGEICDRVAVLSGGTLVFTGTPAQLSIRGGSDNLERAFLSLLETEVAA